MTDFCFVLNVGVNRGNPRVWIEKKVLEDFGWRTGVRYNRTNGDGFTLVKNPEGKLGVAGKIGRPILDLNGAYVGRCLRGADKVAVTITQQTITIKGEDTNE